MRAVKYRRVSTEMQREEGFSLEAQSLRLDAFAESQGWTIVDDYADEGFSAKNTDRPALKRMISDMKKGKFDVILVYRLDRFVRSVTDLHNLLQLMDKYEVMFKSSTEPFDTTTATGRMFITIVATMAQWERETIAERVYENMLKRSEQGLRNGAAAPYGYDLIEGKLIKNTEEAKWVPFMYEQYRSHGSQNIAKKLNAHGVKTKKGEPWSDFSVRYVLTNPIYSGKIRWNHRSLAKGKLTGEDVIRDYDQEDFEPLVSVEMFEESQKLIKQRSTQAFRSDNHYPFSGVGRCAKCGKNFTGSKRERISGGEYRFYKCQGRFRFGTCDVQAIAEESIERAFIESLTTTFVDIDVPEDNKVNVDIADIEQQLKKLQNKKDRTKELYIDGDISKKEYKKRNDEISNQELELGKFISLQEQDASSNEIIEILKQVQNEWKNFSYEEKKTAIHTLFEFIEIEVVEPSRAGKVPKPPVVKITDYQLR